MIDQNIVAELLYYVLALKYLKEWYIIVRSEIDLHIPTEQAGFTIERAYIVVTRLFR